MTQASQLIAKQYTEAGLNKKNWGAVAYNVLVEGLVGDGVTDDTAALQALINTAMAADRRTILFPHGTYYVTALTNADQVDFVGDNSTFTGGYTGTITNLGDLATIIADLAAHEAEFTAHEDNTTTAHGATSAATESKIMARDSSGRSKVEAPVAAGDVMNMTDVFTSNYVANQTIESNITLAIGGCYLLIGHGEISTSATTGFMYLISRVTSGYKIDEIVTTSGITVAVNETYNVTVANDTTFRVLRVRLIRV